MDTVNAMQTILGNTCLHFADVTGQKHRFKNFIEITCENPENGKYSQDSFLVLAVLFLLAPNSPGESKTLKRVAFHHWE